MGLLQNAVKRKTHKERGQPKERKKLGLLEKHKDYKLRAKDYQFKKKRLTALRIKAELRNPDEFYFGMVNAKTVNGVQVDTNQNVNNSGLRDEKITNDYLKMIRTQNMAHLQSLLIHETNKLEKLKSGLHFVGEQQNTKIIFDQQEQQEEEETNILPTENKHGRRAYSQMLLCMEKIESLKRAVANLEMKKNLMGKGKRIKIKEPENGMPAVYKWKNERKR